MIFLSTTDVHWTQRLVSNSFIKVIRGYLSGPLDLEDASTEVFQIAGDGAVGLRVPLGQDAFMFNERREQP